MLQSFSTLLFGTCSVIFDKCAPYFFDHGTSLESARDFVTFPFYICQLVFLQDKTSSPSTVPESSSFHEEPPLHLQVYTRRSKPPTRVAPFVTLPPTNPTSIITSYPESLPIARRKCKRTCVTKRHVTHYVIFDSLSPSLSYFTSRLSSICVPKTLTEALFDPE